MYNVACCLTKLSRSSPASSSRGDTDRASAGSNRKPSARVMYIRTVAAVFWASPRSSCTCAAQSCAPASVRISSASCEAPPSAHLAAVGSP